MKSFTKWSITIVGCVLVFGALAAYKIMEIRAGIAFGEAYPEQSETVEEARVSVADFTPTITLLGEIIAPQRLDLHNEIAGEITAVNFKSGDLVQAGQLLLQLDISVETANLAAAKAKAEVAQLMYDRIAKLHESGATTQDQLDRAKADLTVTLAEISVLERTIAKKTLRSPFDGRAGLHNFEVGQFLPANTMITSLVGATDNVWVDFQMPQFYPQLPTGTAVNILTIGNDTAATRVSATVLAENTLLNANNRTRSYRASIPNNDQLFAPNTVVQVAAPIAEPQQVLQVPALAVQNDPLGQYVFVLRADPNGKGLRAVRQQVRVTLMEAERALLETGTGLAQDDRVAAAGAFKLYEGILVFTQDRQQPDATVPVESGASTVDGELR